MIDRYYEETVTRTSSNTQSSKLLAAKILKYGAIVMIGIFLILVPSFGFIESLIASTKFSAGIKAAFIILICIPFIICGFCVWIGFRLQSKYTEEFEYRIQDCKFRVIRVTNQSRRKLYFEFPLDVFDRIGKADSDACKNAEAEIGQNKKAYIRAAVNLKDKENIYYAYLNLRGGMILYFEPSEDLLRELHMAFGRDLIEHEKPVF